MPRYLGDSKAMVVHDLMHERASCKIKELRAWHRKSFYPDTLEQARSEEFTSCDYCIIYPAS